MGKLHRNITDRVLERISVLRGEFLKQTLGPAIHHALIAYSDELDNPAFGPGGLVLGADSPTAHLPGIDARRIVSFGGLTTVSPAVWTDIGRQLRQPHAGGILPEARRVLVEKAGIIAESLTVVRDFNSECSERCSRFRSLAIDAGRLVHSWGGYLSQEGLVHYDSGGEKDHERRWLLFLHLLGWRGDIESGLRVSRSTWATEPSGRVVFLPFDDEKLQHLKSNRILASIADQIDVPPKRYVSVVEQDVVLASVYALNDIIHLVQQAKPLSPEALAKPEAAVSADSVFISYSHADEKWLNEFDKMLMPAIRNQAVKVWHDHKIKPGQLWRDEIDQAMARARVAVLLLTPNFLSSDFINDEELPYLMDAATRRGVILLWISVEPCMHEQTRLKEIQAVNEPKRPWNSLRGSKRQDAIKSACEKVLQAFNAGSL